MPTHKVVRDFELFRRIKKDVKRHNERLRDAIKKNLHDIIANENIITSDKNKTLKVPIRQLKTWQFNYDFKRMQRTGHGDGRGTLIKKGKRAKTQCPTCGDIFEVNRDNVFYLFGPTRNNLMNFDNQNDPDASMQASDDKYAEGKGGKRRTIPGHLMGREQQGGEGGDGVQGGELAGEEYYETDVPLSEIEKILFEELGLPYLEDKGQKKVKAQNYKFEEIVKSGPVSHLAKRQSIKRNIKRRTILKQKGIGRFWNEDLRYRSWEVDEEEESCAVVIAMIDSSGCLTEGHMIEMANGSYKDISEIKINDKVACIDLNTHKKTTSSVSNKFEYIVDKTIKIKTEDTELRSTGNHKFFIIDSKNGIIEKRADEIQEGDELILVNSWGDTAISHSSVLTENKAYLLGAILGDGILYIPKKKGQYETCIRIFDKDISNLNRYKKLFKEEFNTIGIIKIDRNENCHKNSLHLNNSKLTRELSNEYPMLIKKSRETYVDNIIFTEEPKIRASFISGLFDAEGSVSEHTVNMSSSSHMLVKQIKLLLSYWGIRARIIEEYQKDRSINGHVLPNNKYYLLSINSKDCILFQKYINFRSISKINKLNKLIRRQESGINAMTSKYIPNFRWREELSNIPKTSRVYSYYNNDNYGISKSALMTILSDNKITNIDRIKIEKTLSNKLIISKVKNVNIIDSTTNVYDFEVENYHNYIVDGILSHNSMDENKKFLARSFYLWMVRFLQSEYDNVDIVFINHHTEAKECTEEEFFKRGESGGTKFSSAYKLALDILRERYSPTDWNSYLFHFSDGENWYGDNEILFPIMKEILNYPCNLLGYGEISEDQVENHPNWWHPSTNFADMQKNFKEHERFIATKIHSVKDIKDALTIFFDKTKQAN